MEELRENKIFRAFEHAAYNTRNEGKEGKMLPSGIFEALKQHAGDKELLWYTITANGVKFHHYVGALQVGKYCIEVLPKIDRTTKNEEFAQRVLIDMLRQSGYISVKTPTESALKLKQNFILETYIRMFLDETWEIFHRGLVKYYHKEQGNNNALKGSILFSQQISRNNIHAERFYVSFSTYDREHPLNRILYKTLRLIKQLPVSQDAICSASAQLSMFPELKDIKVNDELFNKLRFNRKTEAYRKAIDIAKLLLLNYHPDLSHGTNNVLAIMFNMNDLWEAWVTKRLSLICRRNNPDLDFRAQFKKTFWTSSTGERIKQKPDIVIEEDSSAQIIILDTKWKIAARKPSEDDIRQMFAYNKLFGAKQSYLLYPGESESIDGEFYTPEDNGYCGLSFIPFVENGSLTSKGIERFYNEHISQNKDRFY